jgi:zinc protease
MRLEIDSVPVFYRNVAGPLRATLLFRVGVVDEALHQRGLSHLVEHLALTHAPDSVHAFNGATGSHFTHFSIAGDDDDVVGFLELVCAGLREPHVERLEHERGVLKAEASTRNPFSGNDQLIWRFGPKGLAGTAYPEWAVVAADDDDVDVWIHQYFHAGNCALWMTAAPPKGLRLQLPTGEGPAPIPEAIEAPVVALPGIYERGRPEVALSWVNPDRKGGNALGWLVSERLTRSLRHEAGLVYGSPVTTERLGPESTWQMVTVDGTAETARQVQAGVVKVLDELRNTPPTAAEIKKLTTMSQLMQQSTGADVGHLDYWTRETLLGREPVTTAAAAQQWKELTADKLTEHIPVLLDSLLLAAPFPTEVSGLGEQLPPWSDRVFKGKLVQPHPSRARKQAGRLFLNTDGISVVREEQGALSIAVAECAGAFRYDDGSVQLYGTDGITLWLASEEWLGFSEVTRWVDRLPAALVHPAGPRTPRDLPMPAATQASGRARRRINWVRAAVPLGLFAVLGVGSALANKGGSGTSTGANILAVRATALTPGECFNGLDTSVPCSQPHQHQVLKAPLQPSLSDNELDNFGCIDAWASRTAANPDYTISVQLQAATSGPPTVLCIISKLDGGSARGSIP